MNEKTKELKLQKKADETGEVQFLRERGRKTVLMIFPKEFRDSFGKTTNPKIQEELRRLKKWREESSHTLIF